MKKSGFLVLLPLVLALSAGTAYAQDAGPRDQGPDRGPGFGPAPGVEWKLGTSVIIEDKKVTGQLVLGERIVPVLKTGDQEYLLQLPPFLGELKNGETLTVEGLVTTVKDGTESLARIHPFTITANGKVIDLRKTAPKGQEPRGPMGPMGPQSDGDPSRL